ncbi:class I and II aminotransferase [Candidatus Bathyarchaeota archaeon ex4484_135]|nr:MAG: class I and II aminotransferase [Candidatus Bathyarchaeota archaeon ex4484_135]
MRAVVVLPGLSSRLGLVRKSPVRRVAALLAEARGKKDLISFGGGAPSLPPPKEVIEFLIEKLREEPQFSASYGGTRGFLELRELISQDLKRYAGIEPDPAQEMIITEGATEGIFLSLMAVVDPGDEVIIMDPTYLGFIEAVKLCGAKPVGLPVYVEEGFQPDIERLKELIGPRTKAMILLSPDNPTGRVIEKERVKAIVDLACDHGFWIISDETYKHIIYEGQHTYTASLPGAWENTITVCTFSKTASIPGFRLGYAYGPAEAIDAMEKIKQYISLCPSTPAQLAMMAFFKDGVKERYLRETVIPTYKARRDVMGKYLAEFLPEAKTVRPAGSFFYFVNMKSYLERLKMDDETLCNQLIKEVSVVAIPGGYFGERGRDHIRLTFVSEPEERIIEGLSRMAKYITEKAG